MQLPSNTNTYRQAQHLNLSHRKRQLPPLQDIVKPVLELFDDRKPKFDDWECQPAFGDCGSSSNTTIATSPTHSIGISMPTLTSNYEELTYRPYNDDMMSSTTPWTSAGHYPSGPTSYASSSSSTQSFYNRPTICVGRNQQNLPSLTEMNLAQNAPTYTSRTMQLTRPTGSGQYYCSSPTDPLEVSYTKTGAGAYVPSLYNHASRSPYNMTNDYNSTLYDPYCYPSGTSWPPTMQMPGSNLMSSDTASSAGTIRRRRGNLPKPVTDILRAWFFDHLDHPYPTDEDKQMLIIKTSLNMSQISNWFINARRRHWPNMRKESTNKTAHRNDR